MGFETGLIHPGAESFLAFFRPKDIIISTIRQIAETAVQQVLGAHLSGLETIIVYPGKVRDLFSAIRETNGGQMFFGQFGVFLGIAHDDAVGAPVHQSMQYFFLFDGSIKK